jgi:hypothetical protein
MYCSLPGFPTGFVGAVVAFFFPTLRHCVD